MEANHLWLAPQAHEARLISVWNKVCRVGYLSHSRNREHDHANVLSDHLPRLPAPGETALKPDRLRPECLALRVSRGT
jgi:hypothetical protein